MSNPLNEDRALLRRFEPVIRYTRGEQFFPMDVETYVRYCSLWVHRPGRTSHCLVPQGELTLEKLAEPRTDEFEAVYFLKFIEPLNVTELAAYRLQEGLSFLRKEDKDTFYAGPGRLARVGYLSRFVDALFSLSLLARGRVPGDTAAAAGLAYRRILAEQERYCYYGRVVRQDGWVALQYWYLYAFNDWRSGFYGANDHESDWEMIYIYLYQTEAGRLQPEWVAYASHDFSGDDLRRRWDDPELEKIDDHPVVYAGAGSHASYYTPGEYLTEIELPFLSPLVRLMDRVQKFWQKTRRQTLPDDEETERSNGPEFNIFRIPFVDYARGDGLSIGPGQPKQWAEPQLLNPVPSWAFNYRGLWGLYADDPLSGENAPAGPLYRRDGTIRRSWYDPLGWAGLDKLPPPDEILIRVMEQQAAVDARCTTLSRTIAEKSRELTGLGVESAAIQGRPHLKQLHTVHEEKMAALSEELERMRAQLASDQLLLEALDLHAAQLRAGERGPARAHIRRAHRPASEIELRLGRFAEMWAALSIGLMLIGFVALLIFAREFLIFWLAMLLSVIVFVEASFRKRIQNLITSITIGLAVVAALVILFEFFWTIVVILVLITGGYIMWQNLSELWT
jgi:hypothetical protein